MGQITQRTVLKQSGEAVQWISPLLTFYLSFKFHFTVVMLDFQFTVNTVWPISVP